MSREQPGDLWVQIREAAPADAAAITALLEQVDRLHVELRPDLFQAAERAVVDVGGQRGAGGDGSTFLVAEEYGRVVGVAEVRVVRAPSAPMFRPQQKAYVNSLAVEEGRRGRGIGTHLLHGVQAWAAARGLDRIEVNVYADNQSAVEFYQRAGFATQLLRLELRLPTTK